MLYLSLQWIISNFNFLSFSIGLHLMTKNIIIFDTFYIELGYLAALLLWSMWLRYYICISKINLNNDIIWHYTETSPPERHHILHITSKKPFLEFIFRKTTVHFSARLCFFFHFQINVRQTFALMLKIFVFIRLYFEIGIMSQI